MTQKSALDELPITKTSDGIQCKDINNIEHSIDPLIEPIEIIDKPVQLVPSTGKRFSGILYTLTSALLFTIPIFITKSLHVELLDALIPRFLFQTILLLIYMKCIKHYSLYKQSEKREILLLIINVFCSTTGFLAFFIAYRYLPLPDVTTIRYTQIIWTAVITAIIYCEKPSVPIILATILTTAGVVCVAQPNFFFEKTSNITTYEITSNTRYESFIGLLIALYASVVLTVMIITNKQLLTKYKSKQSLVTLQYAFVSLCILIIRIFYKYYFHTDRIQSLKNDFFNWKYICASSVCLLHIISSILVQKAVKREHPSIFVIVQSSDVLFSIILQNLFSSIKSNLLSLFGSILVLISILIVSGFKLIDDKRQKRKTVQKIIL